MKLTLLKVDVDDFKKDLVRSTSLCVVEGSAISFCHRTFQEYFAALYILRLTDEQMAKALEAFSSRFETDYVIDLLLSMDPHRIEKNWVIPKLKAVLPGLREAAADARKYFNSIRSEPYRDLIWLRDAYGCDPSSADILAARDARAQMIGSFGVRAAELGNQPEFNELATSDIASLSDLLDLLEKEQEGFVKVQHDVFGQP